MSAGLVSIGDFGRLQQTFALFPAPDGPAVSAGVPAKRTLQRHARNESDIWEMIYPRTHSKSTAAPS